MRKPKDWELKYWLYTNHIRGLIIHPKENGVESQWEIITAQGEHKFVNADVVAKYAHTIPKLYEVLTLEFEIAEEVWRYLSFMDAGRSFPETEDVSDEK
jgi:hypothetical protein